MATIKRELSSDSELSSVPSDLEDDEGITSNTGETSKYFGPSNGGGGSSASVRQSARKRKRESSISHPPAQSNAKPRTVRGSVKKEVKDETEAMAPEVKKETSEGKTSSNNGGKIKLKKFSPPANWRVQYDAIKELRLRTPAVVDTMGCERLAEPLGDRITPKDQRFQTLMALVLSSQTKDTVTSAAIKRMQHEMPGGLTLQSILQTDERKIDDYIKQVGFHNKKSVYIKKIADILRDQYDGDIPDTIDGMTSLPGVGPKMAYLCMAVAWKRVEGIGVDTHVHRIANLLKWVPNTPNPETTRAYLESWLPKELWHEINWLLVGFGQTTCLPRGRRCWECTIGPKSTGGLGICRAAVVPDSIKRNIRREVKTEVKTEPDGSEIKTEVKEEETETVLDSLSVIKTEEEEEGDVKPSLAQLADIEDLGTKRNIVIHEKRTSLRKKRG